MAEELKACRNCGGKCDPTGWMRGDGRQGPECEGCGITTPDVKSWNRLMGEQSASQGGEAVALTVWCGPMPESNGKSNFTAILMRKGADMFDGIAGGITIARSEYPDRVRYEADRMRYLIGELDAEPDILAYDPDKQSGYTPPADQVAEGYRAVPMELLKLIEQSWRVPNGLPKSVSEHVQEKIENGLAELRALLATPSPQ